MAEALVNGVSTTLNGAITNAQTTITIATADIAKLPGSGNYRLAVTDSTNTELMLVTAGQGTATLTVTRGTESYNGAATKFAFASGSTVSQVLTAVGLNSLAVGGTSALSARAYRSAASTSITNNTETTIALDTLTSDNDSMWSSGTNTRLTIKTAGIYLLVGQSCWQEGGAATTYRDTRLYRNGTTEISLARLPSPSNQVSTVLSTTVENLSVNDYIELRVYQNIGSALNVYGGRDLTYLSATRMGA